MYISIYIYINILILFWVVLGKRSRGPSFHKKRLHDPRLQEFRIMLAVAESMALQRCKIKQAVVKPYMMRDW